MVRSVTALTGALPRNGIILAPVNLLRFLHLPQQH
jgi:hypothetical protein